MLRSTRLFLLLLLTEAHLLLCNNCTYVFERLRPKYMKQIWPAAMAHSLWVIHQITTEIQKYRNILWLAELQRWQISNCIPRKIVHRNVQKIPWSFWRRRKLPRTFSFPKATAFWGLMSPDAWKNGMLGILQRSNQLEEVFVITDNRAVGGRNQGGRGERRGQGSWAWSQIQHLEIKWIHRIQQLEF